MNHPLAYHITFGTYGTRLHGDPRGTVDRNHNKPNEPIIGTNPDWEKYEQDQLQFQPIILSQKQRTIIENYLPEICTRGQWRYHLAASQPDHIHCLITAKAEGKLIRRLTKRWLGQHLSKHWPLNHPKARWWAEGGSVKSIWNEQYFNRVHEYIRKQRTTITP